MTADARQLLDAFDRLPEEDRLGVAAEILRRTAGQHLPRLGDEDLTGMADDLFMILDDREAVDGHA